MSAQSKYIYLGKGTLIDSGDYNEYIIKSEQTTNNEDKCNIPPETKEVYVGLYIPLKNEEGTVANDVEKALKAAGGEHKIILSINDPEEVEGTFYDYNINYENNKYKPCKYKSAIVKNFADLLDDIKWTSMTLEQALANMRGEGAQSSSAPSAVSLPLSKEYGAKEYGAKEYGEDDGSEHSVAMEEEDPTAAAAKSPAAETSPTEAPAAVPPNS